MRTSLVLLAWALFFTACSPPPSSSTRAPARKNTPPQVRQYRGSYARINDLVHTRLEIKPDWEKKQLTGKAAITLHPHFYPVDSLVLNARGMELHRVSLVTATDTLPLLYEYDGMLLRIRLNKTYAKEERYTVYIEYTSKPEEQKAGGSAAIHEDKGLYFINADGVDTHKPRQIWTQGETESNSVWFPTLENPQQRMTQEIWITVDTQYRTLSNGKLVQSQLHDDGTRTDCWKQTLPAAPYLTMFAVGGFAVVRDRWRNIDVDYYVEPEYAPYARMTFGHTPEMMDFFSKTFGVDYPWEKYAQVTVREFVSGAMENTTAVVHREALQQTPREYLDDNYEDYIAHELTHHWFGNLVTCESWSNIVLNEGFATYGEYLWREYKFGRDDADHHFQREQNIYLYIAGTSDDDVVRYHYDDREDVYDVISYNKGGLILHMLRKAVGDEAFFAGLKEYLSAHLFSSVEIHDLRLAFEKVSGQDLNWFFNQWYLDKGYPALEIKYKYDDSLRMQTVSIRQTQDFSKGPLYRIPLAIDVYCNGSAQRHEVVLDRVQQDFEIQVPCKPDLVNADAEKMLLGVKKEEKPRSQWMYQYYHAPLYLDRYEAVSKISDGLDGTQEEQLLIDALSDRFWNIRALALRHVGQLTKPGPPALRAKLEQLAVADPKSQVREAAIKALARYYDDDSTRALLAFAITDSSYLVVETAFDLLAEKDKEQAREVARLLEKESSEDVMDALAGFYTEDGRPEYNSFFRNSVILKSPEEQRYILDHYGNYLAQQERDMRLEGIHFLDSLARKAQPWYVRLTSYNALNGLRQELNKQVENPKGGRILTASDVEFMRQESADISEKLRSIRQGETNKKLLRQYAQ